MDHIYIKNKGIEYSDYKEEYFKKRVITRREVVLHFGNGLYEIKNVCY